MRLYTTVSIFTLFILLGCSGHGLQDLADKNYNDKTSNEPSTKVQQGDDTASNDDHASVHDIKASPSEAQGLNMISPSKTATSSGGTMQKSLDTWTKEEWTPTIEKNATIKALNEDPDRPFTLQEYVDKADVYMKESPKDTGASHKEKMDRLPVIGK